MLETSQDDMRGSLEENRVERSESQGEEGEGEGEGGSASDSPEQVVWCTLFGSNVFLSFSLFIFISSIFTTLIE